MVLWVGFWDIYTHLSTTAVSPFLYCFTMSWCVGGSLREFQWCTTYCCTAVVLLYCCCTGLWVSWSVLSCRVLLSCVHTGSWVCLFLFLPLYRPRAGIIKRAASDYDYYSGVLILSFTKKKSFARVLCFILTKDIGRWLPRMLPGSTGRTWKTKRNMFEQALITDQISTV